MTTRRALKSLAAQLHAVEKQGEAAEQTEEDHA